MSKYNKIAFSIFLLVSALLAFMEARDPEPVNWNPSYAASDKIPLGTFVLFNSLNEVFNLEAVSQPPYEFLTSNDPKGTYFFLNDQLLFDDDELNLLLEWTSNGNTLFLASDAFSKNLLDTLNLNVATATPSEGISSKPMLNLVHPDLRNDTAYLYNHETYHSVFRELDTLNQTILGISQLYENTLKLDEPEINFLRAPFGSGEIFINTTPQAFSNYFLLTENNVEYVRGALGYLPTEKKLYWDTYYKTGKSFHTSPLYLVMARKELKWAYYFLIIGSILFVIFEGKRKQRSIPVVKPLENQTYNFTRTISGLYLEKKDYTRIALKKINFFKEYIRTQYRIPSNALTKEFYETLVEQSGNTLEEVRLLMEYIQHLERKKNITKEELLKLNAAIQKFKNINNG